MKGNGHQALEYAEETTRKREGDRKEKEKEAVSGV